jgi:L-seryl-tRNA(Ser) seleniumtransferase
MALDILPPVHEILALPDVVEATSGIAARFRTRLVRAVLAEFRGKVRARREAFPDRNAATRAIAASVADRARDLATPWPRRVVNGTGILIHTNLGRAPLGQILGQIDPGVLSGYSNLEWDAGTRKRLSRDSRVSELVRLLTGGGAALAVNNCAGALLLALGTLARERNVIVSRSELVEIGGGFRVPEIIEASGCRLVEVGTTNKTRLSDYQKAARNGSCVLLSVHQSNFVQRGFVESVPLADLGGLAKKLRVPLVYDNGSGLLKAPGLAFLDSEPSVEQGLRDGAGIVVASGDKLLGSIQAGLIVGTGSLIRAMRKNPLYRALRLDKVRLALLHHTLTRYVAGRETGDVPLWRMASFSRADLEARVRGLRLPEAGSRWKSVRWVDLLASMGGGTNPETTFPSLGLELVHSEYSASRLRTMFAGRDVPIVGYIREGAFVLDTRTMLEEDFAEVRNALDGLR